MGFRALTQLVALMNCPYTGNLEKGSSQGTLWTLLASWFHDHHKSGSRLENSQGLKKGIWKMEENALIKRLGCSPFITFYNKNYNYVLCFCKPWSWWPKTDRMVHLLFMVWLILLNIISNSPWSKDLSCFQISNNYVQLRCPISDYIYAGVIGK